MALPLECTTPHDVLIENLDISLNGAEILCQGRRSGSLSSIPALRQLQSVATSFVVSQLKSIVNQWYARALQYIFAKAEGRAVPASVTAPIEFQPLPSALSSALAPPPPAQAVPELLIEPMSISPRSPVRSPRSAARARYSPRFR